MLDCVGGMLERRGRQSDRGKNRETVRGKRRNTCVERKKEKNGQRETKQRAC